MSESNIEANTAAEARPAVHDAAADDAGGKPIDSARYGQFRDSVLTIAAAALASTKRPLWYAESLVMSARYQQWLRMCDWAANAVRYRDRLELWNRCALPRLEGTGSVALEFGVANGLATQWWASTGVAFAEWHGFDTFEGLPEAWGRAGIPVMEAGVFSPDAGRGAVPQVKSAYEYIWHKGLIEETLRPMTRPDAPLFVMVDVDLLEPTQTILQWMLDNGRPGDLIYFDESFDPWNEGHAIRDALKDGLKFTALGYTGSALLIELT